MAHTLHIATRKGLMALRRGRGGWRLGVAGFLGDNVTSVMQDLRDGALYAGLNLGHFGVKLHRSDDAGKTWKELDAPAFAEQKDQPPPDPMKEWPPKKIGPSVELLWTLVAGGADRPGEIWAGTIPGGLFRSTDRGEIWSLIESLWNDPTRPNWFGGGYDRPGIHSITIDPRDSREMALGISTAGVWRSHDAGNTWELHGKGMRNAYMPPDKAGEPLAQDVHRMARCAAAPDVIWVQHHNGIFFVAQWRQQFPRDQGQSPLALRLRRRRASR